MAEDAPIRPFIIVSRARFTHFFTRLSLADFRHVFSRRGRLMPAISPERMRDRYETILAAASRAFAEKGYETTSITEIARAADVSDGLIYKYFSNKRDLSGARAARLLRARDRGSRRQSRARQRLPRAALHSDQRASCRHSSPSEIFAACSSRKCGSPATIAARRSSNSIAATPRFSSRWSRRPRQAAKFPRRSIRAWCATCCSAPSSIPPGVTPSASARSTWRAWRARSPTSF